MGRNLGDLFNKRDHMDEKSFSYNLSRPASPFPCESFNSYYNIFEDENRWNKEVLRCDGDVMK